MANVPAPVMIGLCGRSGSGKSVIGSFFAKYGIPSVDTDTIYREMTGPSANGELSAAMKAIVSEFGDCAAAPDGSLDRAYLSGIVFSDRGALERLNRVTHPLILDEAERRAASYAGEGYPVVLIDAPALFESGLDKKCRFVIAADAPDDVLVERITARDAISREAAEARLRAQRRVEELPVDLLIDTDRPLPEIEEDVRRLAELLKEKYGNEI